MSLYTWIATLAAVGFVGGNLAVARGGRLPSAWLLPAAGSVAFFGLSLAAVVNEGPVGFWTEHTESLWGNQIWLDLLLSASVGWALMAPEARARGMRLAPWLFVVAGTGSIGFLAMLARLLYLRERAPGDAAKEPRDVGRIAEGAQTLGDLDVLPPGQGLRESEDVVRTPHRTASARSPQRT